jgi:predicted signal transduction protein with EAL and GGDEF domain
MAGAVLQSLDETFRIGGKEVFISASVGISLFPEHGNSSRQLLRNADSAMYLAKANGRRRVEFWSPPEASAIAVAEGEMVTPTAGETLRILSRV